MSRRAAIWTITLTGAIIGVVIALAGCGEREMPFIIDADEIARYIKEMPDAQELFRTGGLIVPSDYTVDFDSGLFRDSLIGHSRGLEVHLVPLKILDINGDSVDNSPDRIYADHGGFIGRVRESVVRVEDRFSIQITRAYPDTTLVDTTEMVLNRYAFLLKLGDDGKAYVGWILWGYNGVGTIAPPIGVTLKSSSGAEFRGDLGQYPDLPKSNSSAIPRVPYIRLTEIDTVSVGSLLLITATKATSGRATYQLISGASAEGDFTRAMFRYDPVAVADSLTFQTPLTNARRYDLVMIQTLTDQTFPTRGGLVVPYRP